MENLEIKVTKTSITVSNAYVLNQGEYQVDKCAFNFSQEYDGLVKKAIFIDSINNLEFEMVILNDECDIPYDILQTSRDFTMKVYGYKVENEELIIRYSPTALKIFLREGSYQGSKEVITPSQFEQYEQALHNGLVAIDDKIEEIDTEVDEKMEEIDNALDSKIQEVDDKIDEVDDKIIEVNGAITQTNNLNIDVSDKVNKKVDVTLTKKDNTTKVVSINDGESLQFVWQGTSLGVKTDSDSEYTFVNLQGEQGEQGIQGEPFRIKKTYSSVSQMQADFYNMNVGDYVMIATSVETEDNAKLYVRGESEWLFITDFSGAQGIQGQTGLTPNIQIGSVSSGTSPTVTRTGTNENPILNFVLEKGEQGVQGIQGQTGNGIASVTKTSSDPETLIDTYTILFTNGTSTTFTVQNGFDGEVQQEDLDEVIEVNNKQQNEIDLLNMLYDMFPKTVGEGIDITLDNTKKAKLLTELNGNLSQETTTGKNKLSYSLQELKNANPLGTWDGNVYTFNGVTYTVNEDLSITTGGTFSIRSYFYLQSAITPVPIDNYILNGCPADGSADTYQIVMGKYDGSSPTNNSTNRGSDTPVDFSSYTEPKMRTYIDIRSADGLNKTFYPMLRLSTETDGTYEKFTYGASPNPDYPQDIKIVTGPQNIKIVNKNLNPTPVDKVSSNVTFSCKDTTLTINGTNNSYVYGPYVPITLPVGTYTLCYKYLSGTIVDNGFSININPATSSTIITTLNRSITNYTSNASTTFTLTEPQSIRVFLYTGNATRTFNNLKIDVQLVKGAEADYNMVAHQEQTYPLSLGSLELAKIGDYKDYIYRENNKWYLNKKINKANDSNFSYIQKVNSTIGDNLYAYACSILNINAYSSLDVLKSNLFVSKILGDVSDTTNINNVRFNMGIAKNPTTSSQIVISILKTYLQDDSSATFRNFLLNNNFYFYYILNTPVITEITDTTLISQLDNLYNANSYDDTTIIFSDGDLPVVMKATSLVSLDSVYQTKEEELENNENNL